VLAEIEVKTLILAGGLGTRLAEETDFVPKPMVKIGEVPIIQHIMNRYSLFGFKDFVIAGGYKFEVIRDYFNREISFLDQQGWRVEVVDTGLETQTAQRVWKVRELLGDKFFLTYGDGLADLDISKLLQFHNESNTIGTVTAVRPPARFGSLVIHENVVEEFSEKNPQDVGWINGGFFVFNKEIFKYLEGQLGSLEGVPLANLARDRNLKAHLHQGWWQPMDTLREKRVLDEMWQKGNPPWEKL
jgi:glucose-1-phosphate cytidylyltransferase